MIDVYRSVAGREAVTRWCDERLSRWGTPHVRRYLDVVPAAWTLADRGVSAALPEAATAAVRTHVVVVGDETAGPEGPFARPRVVLLPDSTSCSALQDDAAEAFLAAGAGPVWFVDVPGRPGLSDGLYPRRHTAAWAAAWLDALLRLLPDPVAPDDPGGASGAAKGSAAAAQDPGELLLVGVSAGAVPVLGASAPGVRRALVSPAGIVSFRAGALVVRDTARWSMRATPATSLAVARRLTAPAPPPEQLVEWLAVAGRACRTVAPARPLPKADLERVFTDPTAVVVGDGDVFLDATALGTALARRETGAADAGGAAASAASGTGSGTGPGGVRVVPGMGHLVTAAHWPEVVARLLRPDAAGAGG